MSIFEPEIKIESDKSQIVPVIILVMVVALLAGVVWFGFDLLAKIINY